MSVVPQIVSNDTLMPVLPLIAISTRVVKSPIWISKSQYLLSEVNDGLCDMNHEQYGN